MSEPETPEGIRKRRRGIYLLPNLFTTATLFAGFYAVVAAASGLLVGQKWNPVEAATEAIRDAVPVAGIDALALMKMDVLDGLDTAAGVVVLAISEGLFASTESPR